MKDLYRYVGKNLRSLRQAKKLSQGDIARLIGYKSAATVSQWERGVRKIGVDDLLKLSILLGVPINYFTHGYKIRTSLGVVSEFGKPHRIEKVEDNNRT